VVTVDTVPENTPMSYPYRALGVHEDGVGSGCCGCVVEMVYGTSQFSIVPGPDPCEGTIEFSGGTACCQPYTATFRVRDLCGTYQDVFTLNLWFHSSCTCICQNQGDYDGDWFLTALDLASLIGVLFEGDPDAQDPRCPIPLGDLDCDGFSTVLDLSGLIDYLFAGGDPPCDPCWEQCQ